MIHMLFSQIQQSPGPDLRKFGKLLTILLIKKSTKSAPMADWLKSARLLCVISTVCSYLQKVLL